MSSFESLTNDPSQLTPNSFFARAINLSMALIFSDGHTGGCHLARLARHASSHRSKIAFSDPSHFARFFRQQTGTTPQEFREQGGG